jgi:hypothetical protein
LSAVVSDSSPLNYLALLSAFDLLRQRLHRSEDGAAVIAKTGILKFERIGTP